MSTATISSLITSSLSVYAYSVHHSVYGATTKKTSIPQLNNIVIKNSGIRAKLDAPSITQQMYTFGPSIPNRWVAAFSSNQSNTLGYSADGMNWNGVGVSILGGGRIAVWNGSMWVAVGDAGSFNSIAYSYDGMKWKGVGSGIFTSYGLEVAWNGSMWVAVGGQNNSIAYSYDGINWTGLGNGILSVYGHAIAWNGRMWVAVGTGNMTMAYSYDGINWIGLGTSIFNVGAYGVGWNGTMWVAVGQGINSIAYSYDGINWIGLGTNVFSPGVGVAWNGTLWVALGQGNNNIAYSYDGIKWVGLGASIFSNARKLAWNGAMFVAGGYGFNSLGYSYNGINWYGLGQSISPNGTGMCTFFNYSRPHQITFPASMLVATGSGTHTLAYSYDGISWTGLGQGIFSTAGNGVASNGSMWVATGSGTNTLACTTNDIETPYIYLPFENGLYSDVMGNSTITVYGAPSFVTGVRGSNAINLVNNPGYAASQYIRGSWAGSSSFTVSFCFNMQSYGGTQTNIFSCNSNTLLIIIYGNSLAVYAVNNSSYGIQLSTSSQPSTNTWYYVTYIHQNNGLCSLYVNNSLVGSYTNIGGLGTSSGLFCIGTYDSLNNWSFNGYIDDFRIYNYAITMNAPIRWRGLGTSIFSTQGYGVAWSGSMWISVGSGTNSIAYSYDGYTWSGLGTSIFTTGLGIAWNGVMWVAVGSGTNSIAYSYNGINWVGLGTNIISQGNAIASNGIMWVAVGSGTNSIAYSYDGINWIGIGATLFTSSGNGVSWNGVRWVATGAGTNTILYSTDGINLSSASTSCFTGYGTNVTWNGTRWVATGSGTNTIGYSSDGSIWNAGTFYANNPITPQQSGLASNTWTQNGVNWTASASSILSSNYPAYGAFNTYYGQSGIYSWASLNPYGGTNGTYTSNINSTTVQTIGTVYGEWIQLQSSFPLTLYSYSYACGAYGNIPQTYYIVGSNNGTTWYPIQYVVMNANPLNNNNNYTISNFSACTSYLLVNQSGTQTINGFISATGTFTTYPAYTTGTYTYFRIIATSIWIQGGYFEFGELYLKFSNATGFTTAGSGIAWNNNQPNITIQHPVIAVGSGTHTLSYSNDGIVWTGLGTNIFSTAGYSVAWNGTRWVATGAGTNTLAYSTDGLRWMGLGSTIFSTQGNGIAWNGSLWIAVGSGTNTIAYSADGINWSGIGTTIFTISGNGIAWNGTQWFAVGTGTNTIAYSTDGINWTGLGTTVFSTNGNGIAWTGSLWVAVGAGTNTLAYSSNGSSWTGLGTTIFSTQGNNVCWNGTRWIAVGSGTNTIAYSSNGVSWFGLGTTLLSITGNGVCWTGSRFVAVGQGINTSVYSPDGLTWYPGSMGPTPYINLLMEGNVLDSMMNTITSTVGTISYVPGIVGNQAVYLSNTTGGPGISYITVPVIQTNSFTVSCWFYALFISNIQQDILSGYTGTYTFYINSSNYLCYYIPTNATSAATVATTTYQIVANRWYHVLGTYQVGGTCAFYVNGTQVGTNYTHGGIATTYSPVFYLGTWSGLNGSFNGYIDDFRIYNSVVPINNIGNGIAGNSRLGAVVCDSQVVLSTTSGGSSTLDIVSDNYYNTGFTELNASIQTQALS